jgi:hypothetical protein
MPPASKRLIIDADDPTGRGQTVAAPAITDDAPAPSELPPLPQVAYHAGIGQVSPREELAEAKRAVARLEAQLDGAREANNALQMALRDMGADQADRVARHLLATLGPRAQAEEIAILLRSHFGRVPSPPEIARAVKQEIGTAAGAARNEAAVGTLLLAAEARQRHHLDAWGNHLNQQLATLILVVKTLIDEIGQRPEA